MLINYISILKKLSKKGINRMHFRIVKGMTIFVVLLLLLVAVIQTDAFARVGGGRSLGSSGSHSYSSPASPYTRPAPS